jgi:hypothetical protein
VGTNTRAYQRARARAASLGLGCWICRGALGPILYGAHPTNERAFHWDMVVPKAVGGDEHDLGGYRAAHRWCNMSRSNRTVEYVRQRIADGYGPGGPHYGMRTLPMHRHKYHNTLRKQFTSTHEDKP